jgi:hypothetical protein
MPPGGDAGFAGVAVLTTSSKTAIRVTPSQRWLAKVASDVAGELTTTAAARAKPIELHADEAARTAGDARLLGGLFSGLLSVALHEAAPRLPIV